MPPVARAPPAALTIVRPRPPCISLRSGGGQTWRRVRGFWLTGWLFVGRAECGNMPPALRAAPQRWASCCRLCRARGHAPRAFGAAPRSGAISWLLERWRFAPGCFELCDEFHEGTRREPRRPNPRQEAQRGAGGLFPHSAKPTSHAGHQPPTQRQVCPPPERQ
jgi:hypothetical protein